MYTKILLFVVIIILSAFFYLHAENPSTVTFVVTKDHTYVMPVTLLLFAGFFFGAAFAVFNSLLIDARRAIREMRANREKKLLALAVENYTKGMDAFMKGDTAEARGLIEKALKANSADVGMIISLSETFARENRPKEALRVLENGAVSNPHSVGILMAIARCAADSGDSVRAARAYEEVLRLDPKNPHVLKRLRELRIKEQAWNEAAGLQRKIVDCEQDETLRKKESKLLTGLLFEAARGLLDEGKLNESVAKVKEVLKNDKSFVPAHLLLGETLYRQGNVKNAVKVWEKAHSRHPNSESLFLRLEDAYIKESVPEKILEKYKREIMSRPNNTNLRLLLARLYLRLEMVDAAIEELERLRLDGEDTFYPQILLGEAYLRRKQGGKAAFLYHRALSLGSEFIPPFTCLNCGQNSKSWEPRCRSCGEWDTLAMGNAVSKASPARA